MTNYQTIKAEANVPGLRRGELDLVDLDDPKWANQLLAGNISVNGYGSVEPEPDEERVPYDADDDFDEEDDE